MVFCVFLESAGDVGGRCAEIYRGQRGVSDDQRQRSTGHQRKSACGLASQEVAQGGDRLENRSMDHPPNSYHYRLLFNPFTSSWKCYGRVKPATLQQFQSDDRFRRPDFRPSLLHVPGYRRTRPIDALRTQACTDKLRVRCYDRRNTRSGELRCKLYRSYVLPPRLFAWSSRSPDAATASKPIRLPLHLRPL